MVPLALEGPTFVRSSAFDVRAEVDAIAYRCEFGSRAVRKSTIGPLNRDQRGLTLLELIIAIALTVIVTAGITAVTLNALNIHLATTNRMTAIAQVRHVGFWLTPDVMMAQPDQIDTNRTSTKLLTLNWTAPASNVTNSLVYAFEAMAGSGEIARLKRAHYIGSNSTPDSVYVVAEYIDPTATSCRREGDAVICTVTATVGKESVTKEYRVKPRPD